MSAQNASSRFAKAAVITGVSLALGLAFNHFFYDKLPGLAFPVFVALIVAGLFAVSGFTRQRISRPAKWLLAPLALFSVNCELQQRTTSGGHELRERLLISHAGHPLQRTSMPNC